MNSDFPDSGLRQLQLDLCTKHGVSPVDVAAPEKVGISQNIRSGELPINGLRLKPENGTSGWLFWRGREMSLAPDFFVPLHAEHLASWCPVVLPFLLLPPGWRFLVAHEHVDAWFDASLLHE